MNRFLRPLIVIALLVGMLPVVGILPVSVLSSGTASAAPAADLAALAAYFPADTPFFAALRIDDGHIEALDGLLNAIGTRLPPGILMPGALRNALDTVVQESNPEGSFAADVRPWLGDFGAVGITTFDALVDDDPSNDSDLPSAVVAQITDRDAAEAFFETIMSPGVAVGYFELRKTADFTVYASPDPSIPVSLVITNDLLVLALAGLDWTQMTPASTLADDPTFQRGLAALPAADYNAAFYVSGAALDAFQAAQAGALSPTPNTPTTAMQSWAGEMIGLTILDGGTLTIDSAVLLHTDTPGVVQDILGGSGAIAPAFDAFLAGDAQFVVRATSLRDSIAALLEAAQVADPGAQADLEEVATNIREGVQQVLGLDVDEDIVSWLSGDFAVTFSLDPGLVDAIYNAQGETPEFARFPFDFGLVVAAIDPAKAQGLIAALSDQLPALLAQSQDANVTVTLETIGGHSAIVLDIPIDTNMAPIPGMELLIGASGDVFALGTRAVVTAALAPGDGLTSQPAYTRARSYALPGAVSFGYVSNAGVQSLGDLFGGLVLMGPQIGETFSEIEGSLSGAATLTPEQQAERERQLEQQRQQAVLAAQMARAQISSILSLIESLTFSTAPVGDGVYLQRATLTLAPTP